MIYINNCKLLIINRCKDIKKYQLLNYSSLLIPPTSPSPSHNSHNSHRSHCSHRSHYSSLQVSPPKIPFLPPPLPPLPPLAPYLCPCGSHPPEFLRASPSLSEFFIKKIFLSFSTNYKKLSKKVAKKFAG